jgi:hypothetical protein
MRVTRTIALAIGLFGAAFASQLPEFVQQYNQRLGGAIDEIHRIVERFDEDAAANGLSRREAITKLAANPDDVARRRARDASQNAERLSALESQRRELNEAGPFGRVVGFFRYADPGVTGAAMRDYEPAVPTTPEGLGIAGIGFLLGWGLTHLVGWPIRRWRERRRYRIYG